MHVCIFSPICTYFINWNYFKHFITIYKHYYTNGFGQKLYIICDDDIMFYKVHTYHAY